VISLVLNGLEAAGTVAWATTKMRFVPSDMLGRVSSLDWFISIAGLPISYALTAPVAALIGAQATFIAGSLLCAAVTFGALFLPHMRDVDGALTTTRQSALQEQKRQRVGSAGRHRK
jgi:hypothetical protein